MANVEIVMDERTQLARNMLNRKLIKLSWALFFILLGGSWTLGSINYIDSTRMWVLIYAGSGGILLLLNLFRMAWKIEISRFSIGLGLLGLVFGIVTYYNLSGFSILAAVLLIIGILMLYEVLRKGQ